MEQVSEEGRGNNSTEERRPSSPKPPTINWPGAKLIDLNIAEIVKTFLCHIVINEGVRP